MHTPHDGYDPVRYGDVLSLQRVWHVLDDASETTTARQRRVKIYSTPITSAHAKYTITQLEPIQRSTWHSPMADTRPLLGRIRMAFPEPDYAPS